MSAASTRATSERGHDFEPDPLCRFGRPGFLVVGVLIYGTAG